MKGKGHKLVMLAQERTQLANSYTLAYWRTGLTFLALGAVLLKLFNSTVIMFAIVSP